MAATDHLQPNQFKRTLVVPLRERPDWQPGIHVHYSPDWSHPKRARKQINDEVNARSKR